MLILTLCYGYLSSDRYLAIYGSRTDRDFQTLFIYALIVVSMTVNITGYVMRH